MRCAWSPLPTVLVPKFTGDISRSKYNIFDGGGSIEMLDHLRETGQLRYIVFIVNYNYVHTFGSRPTYLYSIVRPKSAVQPTEVDRAYFFDFETLPPNSSTVSAAMFDWRKSAEPNGIICGRGQEFFLRDGKTVICAADSIV